MKFYHITEQENRDSIINNGLRANNEGIIFLFNCRQALNMRNNRRIFVSDHIASSQIFLDEYLTFEVDMKGIQGKLENDCVAEITSKFQWILYQQVIEPVHLKLIGIRKVNRKALDSFLR